jgi:hypothetical protein
MNFCTKCGRSLSMGARFCTGCGVAVQPATARPATAPSAAGQAGPIGQSAPSAPKDSAPCDNTVQAAASSGVARGLAARPSSGPPRPRSGLPRAAGRWRPWLDGQRATVALVAAAVLIAAGVITGVEVAGQHGRATAAGHASRPKSGSPAPASAAAPGSTVTSPTSSVSTSSGQTPSASASPGSSGPSAGAGTIQIGPLAAGQPDADQVASFLSQYFAAIKNRDYAAYAVMFVSGAVPDKTAGQFRNGYRSTTDSDAELVRLSASPAGLAASVTFRSHQSAAASVTHTACTSWGITFYLQANGSSYLIGPPPAGYQASYHPCS